MAVAVVPDAAMKALIALLLADEIKLRLGKNNITVGKSTVIGDFTEADFTGYAAVSITWGTVAVDGSHNAYSDITPITFTRSSGATSNTIYTWYVTNSAGSVLYAGRTLDTPIPMTVNGDQLTISLTELLGDLP